MKANEYDLIGLGHCFQSENMAEIIKVKQTAVTVQNKI